MSGPAVLLAALGAFATVNLVMLFRLWRDGSAQRRVLKARLATIMPMRRPSRRIRR